MTLTERLFNEKDPGYKEFHSKLMPGISKDRIIGVRTPIVKRIAKEATEKERAEFLDSLPHEFYEENNLHAAMINSIKSFRECVEALDMFLPYVDNWATCDMLTPKIPKESKDILLAKIKKWISSEHCYTVRFGIGMLMRHFLDEDYSPEYPALVGHIESDEYYVNMMISWYFATALAKQYNDVIPYLEKRLLSKANHRRTIQKAIESLRIPINTKHYLKTLR